MSEQVQEQRGLTIRIRDKESLIQAIQKMKDLYYEMEKFNVRTLQFHAWTKSRWMEGVKESINFFEKFLPKDKE